MGKFTNYLSLLDFHISGIPCIIAVQTPGHYKPANLFCHPDRRTPEEYDPPEYRVLDKAGYLAEWLEEKITTETKQEIFTLINENMKGVWKTNWHDVT